MRRAVPAGSARLRGPPPWDGTAPPEAVVTSLRDRVPPGVKLVLTDGEPTRLIEAWTGAALAVVVDAVREWRQRRDRPGRASPCTE